MPNLADVVKGMTAQVAQQAGVPQSRIEHDPVYRVLAARVLALEATVTRQAQMIGELAIAVEKLEGKKS